MKQLLSILALLLPFLSYSQTSNIKGEVVDLEGKPLQFATVTLLNPADSTLAHFAITNANGMFEINNIPSGNFLMQSAFLGYKTFYKNVSVPLPEGEFFGAIVLQPNSLTLGEVQVKGERIPLVIKQDTVEYNAGSFKVKTDAVAEDLLKKLPGVEVDRAGNVKAMGEDVKKVLVDGKEFFGNDTKVATKNLPADAISKVQVYNKKSDESEMLGLDDKEYEKTINFTLKDDKKNALFGDVKAGGDASNYYIGNAKAYRFTDKHQLAVLGMLNNVNRPGFSFNDYISFNGGISNMMSGGRVTFSSDSDLPIDFGQSVNGDVTSGAGGLNYSYEVKKNNRLNLSYMGNGTNKNLVQDIYSRNFTNSSSFEQKSNEIGDGSNQNHLINFGWRNKSDSLQYYMVNGIVTLSDDNSTSNSATQNFTNSNPVNILNNHTRSQSNQLKANVDGSVMRKLSGKWKMVKLSGNFQYSNSTRNSSWNNAIQQLPNPISTESSQFFRNNSDNLRYSATAKSMRRLAKNLYLEPVISAGSTNELLNRKQGDNLIPIVDSLSPKLNRTYQWVVPELNLKYYHKKSKFYLSMKYETGKRYETLNDSSKVKSSTSFFLPALGWDYSVKSGQRLGVSYSTSTTLPTNQQLIPIISNTSPLAIYYGNRYLKPEVNHSLFANWFLFDNFSLTSIIATLNATYTKDKINNSYVIGNDLSQKISLVNVPYDYSASAMVDFSTPIRFLGIKVNVGAREVWNKGINYVNTISNTNTNLTQSYKLSFDNRKKDKWDIMFGGEITLTNAKYSIQKELNRKYYSYTYFGEINFSPNDRLSMRVSGDVTSYNSNSFNKEIIVPLIGAEVNYYLTKNKRIMLTLEGADLLDKNKGISRTSNLNYLREVRSNTIGRYFLLSLKFRLNKFGDNDNGMNIKIKNH